MKCSCASAVSNGGWFCVRLGNWGKIANEDFEVINIPVRRGKNHVKGGGFSAFQIYLVTAPKWISAVKRPYKVSLVIIHVYVYTYIAIANAFLRELYDLLCIVVISDCGVYYNRSNAPIIIIPAVGSKTYVRIIISQSG